MKNQARPKGWTGRLRLNRETVRVLSARSLANVAGGSQVIGMETLEGEPPIISAPKTNIWTGGGDVSQYEPGRVCAGGPVAG